MTITANEQAALDYLSASKKLTRDCAVGIAAVLAHESSLNPLSENNSGTETGGVLNPKGSYGIAQWNGPRQAALSAFATKYGQDPSKIETQLWFVLNEAATGYPQFWAAIQNLSAGYSDVITAMASDYERPADPAAEISAAMTKAAQLYAEWTPSPASTPAANQPAALPTAPSVAGGITITIASDKPISLEVNGVSLTIGALSAS